MQTPDTDTPATGRETELAGANWRANLDALRQTQRGLADALAQSDAGWRWTLARDGSLTALDASGQWWGGCSVPCFAARELLRKLEAVGTAAYVCPTHGAELEVALERLSPRQAVIAIVPVMKDLAVMLHCVNLSQAIRGHRLWFAAGDGWEQELGILLDGMPGLPVPQNFIRTKLLDDETFFRMSCSAQRVLSGALDRRQRMLQEARSQGIHAGADRVVVVAPSEFRLWDDAGRVLVEVVRHAAPAILDPDDPAQSTGLAVALACRDAAGLVVPNRTRRELGEFVPDDLPIVSWLTVPLVPPFSLGMERDGLIVAHPSWVDLARRAGWPVERIVVGGWPATGAGKDVQPGGLAIVADTSQIEPPRQAVDLSSHRLLWEMIGSEMNRDPFVVAGDVQAYLGSRMRRLGISPEGFDPRPFVEDLILPAYQQGLASILHKAGLPLALYGRGWNRVESLAACWRGQINDRVELERCARSSVALVHVWPSQHAHAIEAVGRPVVRAGSASALVAEAKRALAGELPVAPSVPPISHEMIRSLLGRGGPRRTVA